MSGAAVQKTKRRSKSMAPRSECERTSGTPLATSSPQVSSLGKASARSERCPCGSIQPASTKPTQPKRAIRFSTCGRYTRGPNSSFLGWVFRQPTRTSYLATLTAKDKDNKVYAASSSTGFSGGVALVPAAATTLPRGYWRRLWIVQEVMLAQEVWLMCGTCRPIDSREPMEKLKLLHLGLLAGSEHQRGDPAEVEVLEKSPGFVMLHEKVSRQARRKH